jgi:Uma2 family endonuclease
MSAEALLENPAVRARIARFTVEQYHQLGEYSATGRRTELIRGYVFDKMSKSPLHSSIGTEIYDVLFPQIPSGWWIRKEEPLTLADSEPEPDVSIVRGTRRDYEESHPRTAALVVEVAVTTLAEDRELISLYAEAGVEEYWIVIPRERKVEVYRRPIGGAYLETQIVSGDATLTCAALPGIQIPLAQLFA